MKVDPVLSDILFLDRHPGWTWADLEAAPDEVVEGLRMIDRARNG